MMNTLIGNPRQSLWWVTLVWLWSSAIAQNETAPTAAPLVTSPPTSSGWEGCVDANTGYQPITIGEPTTICLNIANGADWSTSRTYFRLNFQPNADQYSRFHVPLSYNQLVADGSSSVATALNAKNITVFVTSQQGISFQKKYFDDSDHVYPYLTAIIDVADGVVQGIVWDDASIFCGPDQQRPNTLDFAGFAGSSSDFGQPVEGCFIPTSECDTNADTNTACDLLLYVVWTGTDKNKRPFMSSNYRFSAFPPQEWADRITNNLPDVNPFNDEN